MKYLTSIAGGDLISSSGNAERTVYLLSMTGSITLPRLRITDLILIFHIDANGNAVQTIRQVQTG